MRYIQQPDPTPEQIAAATAKIRATWSKREERKRRNIDPDAWYMLPELRTVELFGDGMAPEWRT